MFVKKNLLPKLREKDPPKRFVFAPDSKFKFPASREKNKNTPGKNPAHKRKLIDKYLRK